MPVTVDSWQAWAVWIEVGAAWLRIRRYNFIWLGSRKNIGVLAVAA